MVVHERLSTPLARRLGITVPVIQAGMALVARPALVAAVSNAGGLGVLGAAASTADLLARELDLLRSLTDRPIGVDLVFPAEVLEDEGALASRLAYLVDRSDEASRETARELRGLLDPRHVESLVEVCIDRRVRVVVAALGSPRRFIEALHAADIVVLALVGTVTQARRYVDEGVDAVVACGTEAGGHVGSVGSLSLWRSVVNAVDVPVVAAGGVVGGAELAAALVLGCQAVWVGTRFLATHEAEAHPRAKQRLLGLPSEQTVRSRAYSGKPMRVVRNRYVDHFESSGSRAAAFPLQLFESGGRVRSGLLDGDLDEGALPAGQGTALIEDLVSAATVVRRFADEATRALG